MSTEQVGREAFTASILKQMEDYATFRIGMYRHAHRVESPSFIMMDANADRIRQEVRAALASLPAQEPREGDVNLTSTPRVDPVAVDDEWSWIAVDERLPQAGVQVICAGQGWGEPFVMACWYDDERREWWQAGSHRTDAAGGGPEYPTHWMPLPAAPKIPEPPSAETGSSHEARSDSPEVSK